MEGDAAYQKVKETQVGNIGDLRRCIEDILKIKTDLSPINRLGDVLAFLNNPKLILPDKDLIIIWFEFVGGYVEDEKIKAQVSNAIVFIGRINLRQVMVDA